jgi:hypothetical protein
MDLINGIKSAISLFCKTYLYKHPNLKNDQL